MILFQLSTLILYSILAFIIMLVNLFFIHKGMEIFDKWLAEYEEQSK